MPHSHKAPDGGKQIPLLFLLLVTLFLMAAVVQLGLHPRLVQGFNQDSFQGLYNYPATLGRFSGFEIHHPPPGSRIYRPFMPSLRRSTV